MRRPPTLAWVLTLALATCFASDVAWSYPLDGYQRTGIARLEQQRLIQVGELPGRKRPSGELLPLEQVDLRLTDRRDFTLPKQSDPKMLATLRDRIGPDRERYGVALLDMSDPKNPRYAEWKGNTRQNPGSVGKLLVALAIFQALADAHPDDIEARERVLREAQVRADVFSVYDHHTVRMYDVETRKLVRRPIHKGDTASLWTFLDWMMSPSSNSAAAMLQKHLILMAHFGERYPVSPEEEDRFFEETPRKELSAIFEKAIQSPVTRNGLDLETLRQGSFFTRQGKKQVPGTSSYATPRALVEFMLKMEQGLLVDEWSSREIKRLMYITERRIRYGSSGILRPSAVYFKSGSLYSCEPKGSCKKYHGNKRNYMNSTAIVETAAGQDQLFYMVAVLSNVLGKNSAQDHRDLARAVHLALLRDHPQDPEAEKERRLTYGKGFIGYAEERAGLRLKVDTQEVLQDLGYDIGEVDGVIGKQSRAAIRDFERKHGRKATGKPSAELLTAMQAVAQQQGKMR